MPSELQLELGPPAVALAPEPARQEATAPAVATGVPVRVITLASDTDFDGFRRAARTLVADGVEPDAVDWAVASSEAPELFGADGVAEAAAAESADAAVVPAKSAAAFRVPAEFISLCRQVALHDDRRRFALLYRLLWRLQHEPGLRHDALDAQMAQARLMAQAVRRDMHKMKAFVRFREVARADVDGVGQPPLHVAWFEPQHHIVEVTAPFFMRRFADMPWAILTPERCVRWDGTQLEFSPGASRQDAPAADAGEALWLTYYRHIFNPARLKLRMMEKEMPRRYWHNLPEAELISGLAAEAHARSGGMLERDAVATRRRLGVAMADVATAGKARRTAALPPLVAAPAGEQPSAAAGGSGLSEFSSLSGGFALAGGPGLSSRSSNAPVQPATLPERQAAWAAQRQAAAQCRECPLGALATQTVWGEGPIGAALMLVGEQAGDQEDLQGKPFVGPAGQLLNRAMVQLGWDRSVAYVTNAVKHFKYEPRGKRRVHKTPAQREADACQHWMESEIALVQPTALVALGATAARQLLGRPVAVTRERGQWLQRADGLPVLITLHPSALLRAEPADREAGYAAWLADLRLASRYAAREAPGA